MVGKQVTKQQAEAGRLYTALLEEVKVRIYSIDSAVLGRLPLHPQIVREFCFLQLRMLCELIALGSLTAHGEIQEVTKLRKEYSADKILDRLEKLHPDFYPIAVKSTQTPAGRELAVLPTGFLTKIELLKLYGRCGDALHRGSMKKLLSSKPVVKNEYSDIIDWEKKIVILLNEHAIFLISRPTFLICNLATLPNHRAQVSIAGLEKWSAPPE